VQAIEFVERIDYIGMGQVAGERTSNTTPNAAAI